MRVHLVLMEFHQVGECTVLELWHLGIRRLLSVGTALRRLDRCLSILWLR